MEEKIDRYILGTLPADELEAFEELLQDNADLREQVALQREIITAVQLSAADTLLRRLRARHTAEQAEAAEQEQRRAAAERRRRRAFSWGFATIALAACFVVGLFVHLDYKESYTAYGNSVQLPVVELRGEEVLSNEIIAAIEAEQYDRAHTLIAKAGQTTFDAALFADSTADEVAYEQEIYAYEQALVEWLEAVTLMREGRWMKARRQLKAIAASESPYRDEATRALEAISN